MACCGRSGSRCSPRQGIARIVVFGDPGLVTLFGLPLIDEAGPAILRTGS
jgi:hypothetical protein